jgi:DNA-binding transcriptional regulator YiaG
MLNIIPKALQAWEQGSRETGCHAALKLLTIVEKHPEILLEA